MKSGLRILSFGAAVVLAAVIGMIFSHHGLRDLWVFQQQMAVTQQNADQIEQQNRKLKAHLDLLSNPSEATMERQLREILGWARPGEIVYLEK